CLSECCAVTDRSRSPRHSAAARKKTAPAASIMVAAGAVRHRPKQFPSTRLADLGEGRGTLTRSRRRHASFDELHVQLAVSRVFGMPLDACDPPVRVFSFVGFDQSVGSKRRHAEIGRKLADSLVMIAVDPNLTRPINLLEPSARLHDDRVAMRAAV